MFDHTGKVAEKIMDLGNIAAGALLFGQAFSGFPFNLRIAILGIIALVDAYAYAWLLVRGGVK